MPLPFPYEYDPEGTLLDNKIVNELHVVVPPTDPELANFIVPRAAPFYVTGLKIRTGTLITDPELTEGVDYVLTHHFVEATQALNKAVYGSIMFLDRSYTGNIYLTYQTLGGAYTLDDYSIVESLTRSLYNLRVVTWTQIAGLPAAFPPVEHPHDVADLTGMSDVVAVLEGIRDELIALGANVPSLAGAFQNHITTLAGAHTKGAVGLGLLDNFATAVEQDIIDLATNKYVTPAMVKRAIELYAAGAVGTVPDATTTIKGIVRRATQTEGINGANVNAYITPAVLAAVLSSMLGGSGFATTSQLSDEANIRSNADNVLQNGINSINLILGSLSTALSNEAVDRQNADLALLSSMAGMESAAQLVVGGNINPEIRLITKKPGIWINGAFRMGTAVQVMAAVPAYTFYYVYAYWDGTDIQLHYTLTSYVSEPNGVKAFVKGGDPTRTLVGLYYRDNDNNHYVRSAYGDRRQYVRAFDPEDFPASPYTAVCLDPLGSYPFNCTTLASEYNDPSPTSDLADFEMPVLFFSNETMNVRWRLHFRYTTITGTADGMIRFVVGTPATGFTQYMDIDIMDPAGGSDDRVNVVTVEGHFLIGPVYTGGGVKTIRIRAARNSDPDGGQGAGNYIIPKLNTAIVEKSTYADKVAVVDTSTVDAQVYIPNNNRSFVQLIYDEPSQFFYLTPNY